jgi:hypothetical protein
MKEVRRLFLTEHYSFINVTIKLLIIHYRHAMLWESLASNIHEMIGK